MRFYSALYITRFFFILLSIVILEYVLASIFPWMENLAFISLILLLFFFTLDVLLTFTPRKPVLVNRKLQEIMNLGDENLIEITIENQYNQALFIELFEAYPIEMQKRESSGRFLISSSNPYAFSYSFIPKKRGQVRFGKIELFMSSLLSLCKRKLIFDTEQLCHVYPSILQMKKFELQLFHKQSLERGIKKIRRIGHNNEFEQIKNYVQGDDIRSINWKATSRKNELMVNQYQEERSQYIYAVIDKSRSMKAHFEDLTMLDYAINSTLVFSNIALKKGDKAGLITFSDKIGTQLKAERSSKQLRLILNHLYHQKTNFAEANYELLYHAVHQTVKTRSLLMLYTNFDSEFALKAALPVLRKLNQKHVLCVVLFIDNDMHKTAYRKATNVDEIYLTTVAEKLYNKKITLAKELKQHGIYTVLTRPEELSANNINQYLELKAKGVI